MYSRESMPKSDILLTGGTGYIGFHVLVEALKAGYSVRVAVRSIFQGLNTITSAPSIKELAPGKRLTFLDVADICADGAYNEALQGITYVIHVASPLLGPNITDYQSQLIDPALKGTTSILKSALENPTIKKVVITSSVAANRVIGSPKDMTTVPESRIPTPEGPFTDGIAAYCASKIAALNATDAFVEQHKPHFDVINIMPTFVTGAHELAKTAKDVLAGTRAFPIMHLVAPEQVPEKGMTAAFVNDVALAHIRALDSKIVGNRSFGALVNVDWSEAFGIVKKHFPKAVDEGVFKDNEVKQRSYAWDASSTEEELGIKFAGFEEQTISIAKQYLQVLGKVDAA